MPLRLSPEEARAFLGSHRHDARDLIPLSGGLWSTTFAFVEAGVPYVVRFHERRDDLEKDRFAMQWSSPALRIPRIVEIGDAPEGAYGISEREAGGAIDELDEAGMRAVLPALFATLDALRDADVAGATGYGLWHGDGNAPYASWRASLSDEALIAGVRAPLAGSSVGTEAFDAGIARMRELLDACPEDKHVVHNDLLYHNVTQGRRASSCSTGAPRSTATSCTTWRS